MPESVSALRPQIDTYERAGWRLTIVDAPRMLAASADGPVDMLGASAFPSPVRRVRMTVAAGVQDGAAVFLVEAGVRTGGPVAPRPPFALLGNDPIGTLLARRAAAGDQRAIRVRDGLETAVGQVSRRLGIPPPAPVDPSWECGVPLDSQIVIDDATGLRTTVTRYALPGAKSTDSGRIIMLRAAVAAGLMSSAHLASLFDALVAVVNEVSHSADRQPSTAQTAFVLSRHPLGASGHPERVDLDQVGGLDDVVATFREIAISFRHPEAMARWGARRPQGILLYGPAGTGKTMLARALAHEIGGTLREIRTPEILDKWLGASERNMKRIFSEARRYRAPTVMLFDEFDSIISYVGAGTDSGGQAVNAVAGIFKQEMNSLIDDNPNVIVVATTNFPHLIDDSLIRSGRFDIRIEIPAPDARGREQIMTRMIRGLIAEHEVSGFQMFADDVNVGELATLSNGLTGADLREVLRRAQMVKAMQQTRMGVEVAPIGQDDLRDSIQELLRAARYREP